MTAKNHGQSDADIATAWSAFYLRHRDIKGELERPFDDADADWWAVEAVMDLQSQDPIRALEIAFMIARQCSDEWVLVNLGAGPLESLLAEDPTLLNAIELEAKASRNLVRALGSVWQNRMPDTAWATVQRLAALR